MRHAVHAAACALPLVLAASCARTPVRTDAARIADARDQMLARINALPGDGGAVRLERVHPFTDRLVVEEYRLGNGLTILVMEDHAVPVFTYQTWFRVGSRNEREGITGIAHLFEHLLFKESENLGDGVFDRLLELNGGRVNASTWVGWTYYREHLPTGPPTLPDEPPQILQPPPADRLELVVRLEADRMAHMVIDEAQVEAEREVVKNERRYRVDNDPEGKMYESLYELAYTTHPYRWPTVGWMRDLDAITLQDCVAFYRTYYSPNNATVVLVGDLSTERVLGLLRRHYGSLPAQEIPPFAPAPEPRQETERRVELTMPLAAPKVLVGYRIPSQPHPDHPAVEVANELLFEGRSSRVYRRMVTDEEIASEVSGWVAPFSDPGLLEVMVTLKSGRLPEQGDGVLSEELDRLRRELVPEAELAKAKNRLEAEFLRGLQTVGGKARNLGHFATTAGDFAHLFSLVERYRDVSAEDVRRVAQVYLGPERRTVVTALPAKGGGGPPDGSEQASAAR